MKEENEVQMDAVHFCGLEFASRLVIVIGQTVTSYANLLNVLTSK